MAEARDANDAVVIERIYDAPPDVIWRMWTEAQHFEAWYGPPGAAITVKQMDVRVGGSRLVGMEMQTPNGAMLRWCIPRQCGCLPSPAAM